VWIPSSLLAGWLQWHCGPDVVVTLSEWDTVPLACRLAVSNTSNSWLQASLSSFSSSSLPSRQRPRAGVRRWYIRRLTYQRSVRHGGVCVLMLPRPPRWPCCCRQADRFVIWCEWRRRRETTSARSWASWVGRLIYRTTSSHQIPCQHVSMTRCLFFTLLFTGYAWESRLTSASWHTLTLWRPLLPYGYSYKASCASQTGLSRHL